MDQNNNEPKPIIKRIGGYLHKLVPVVDSTGKIISHTTLPFMVEFTTRDFMQVIVGASILAVPVAFTEETWKLGEQLSLINIIILGILSLVFISAFVYFNFYRFHFKDHMSEYIKRVIATYLCSVIVVGIILTIIDKCPWGIDNVLVMKRIIIVAFPASMSAVISDTIK